MVRYFEFSCRRKHKLGVSRCSISLIFLGTCFMNRHPFTLHFGYKIQRAPAFAGDFRVRFLTLLQLLLIASSSFSPSNYRSLASQASPEPTPSSRLRLYRPHSNDASNRPSRLQLTIAYNSARRLFPNTRLRYNLTCCNSAK